MKKALTTSLLVAAGLTVGSNIALAAEQTDLAQNIAVKNKTTAINALNMMSEYLGSLDKFVIHASVSEPISST